MPSSSSVSAPLPSPASPAAARSIWFFACGYFAAYVPYGALTKALTDGRLGPKMNSFEILPVSVVATVVAMLSILTALGWWRYATHGTLGGRAWPRPSRWTFVSGVCTGLIIVTTTMAYAIQGVSIVFAMLLLRGGLIIMAPIVDAVSRRRVRWFSWIATGLSFGALSSSCGTFAGGGSGGKHGQACTLIVSTVKNLFSGGQRDRDHRHSPSSIGHCSSASNRQSPQSERPCPPHVERQRRHAAVRVGDHARRQRG